MLYRESEVEKEASSKSINKTISELKALLEGERISAPSGSRRDELHKTLKDLLRYVAKRWYRRGFRRGHKTCYSEGANVPKIITKNMLIYAPYLTEKGETIKIKVESKLKSKSKKKMNKTQQSGRSD